MAKNEKMSYPIIKMGDAINEINNAVGGVDEVIPPFVDAADNATKIVEIYPGMTVEEMQSLFFDAKALIEPKYKVYQLNSKGHRYYYTFNEETGEPEFYPSVTTILAQTLPQSTWLIKWVADKGYDEAERYKEERAAYGSFMHAQFEQLLINRTYDLDMLKSELRDYIESQRLPSDFINYADDLKKDILAFAQFIIDYDVKPLAVEIALVHPDKHYAGMLDLPCEMAVKIGSKERLRAIVDFKSGRKAFYEEHEIQLGLYRDMWNANFPDAPIEKIFNFSPKDWRKKPTYNLKDQTESPNLKKIPYLLELAQIEDDKLENVFTACNGIINLDGDGLQSNIISLSLAELVKTKKEKKQKPAPEPTPEQAVNPEDMQAPEPEPESPEPEPTPEPVKTKIVKRKRKAAEKPEIKPVAKRKTVKRAITPEKEEKPVKTKKRENNGEKKMEKKNKVIDLLNTDLDL